MVLQNIPFARNLFDLMMDFVFSRAEVIYFDRTWCGRFLAQLMSRERSFGHSGHLLFAFDQIDCHNNHHHIWALNQDDGHSG